MDYFEILNLQKEPFSNSPDPDFFYQSRQHKDCLQKLEIAIRLRRGLNVVIGDVGTGKTTLCRQLIRRFDGDESIETYLMLDPQYPSPEDFLTAIDRMFQDREAAPAAGPPGGSQKERIKTVLFQKGVDEEKTVVFIIDEGQKIPASCLEVLRELLNYETNDRKLLQIVIFAQPELEGTIEQHANFADRINLYHRLGPLDFRDTWQMIEYRLRQSSPDRKARPIFSLLALVAIYVSTGGYPRKIINLCHQSILAMIVQNHTRAGWFLIRSCARRTVSRRNVRRPLMISGVLLGLAIAVFLYFPTGGPDQWFGGDGSEQCAEEPRPAEDRGPERLARAAPDAEQKTGKTWLEPSVNDGGGPPSFPESGADLNALPVQKQGPPTILGQVAIRRGESLGRICLNVFGRFNAVILRKVVAANPHITDPDQVAFGTVINIPAVPAEVKEMDMACWWVSLGEQDSLQKALAVVRSFQDPDIKVRLIPYYSRESGLRFAVVSQEYFFDRPAAQKALDRISKTDFPDADIRSNWHPGQGEVLFANPYLVYKMRY